MLGKEALAAIEITAVKGLVWLWCNGRVAGALTKTLSYQAGVFSAYPLLRCSGVGRRACCSQQLWPLLRLAERNSKALGHAVSPRAILCAIYV